MCFTCSPAISATFAMSNPHSDYQLPYKHFSRLMSPTIRLTHESCLKISLVTYTPCTVKLVYYVGNAYQELVVYKSILSSNNISRNLQISLSPERNNFTEFIIVLETTTTINDKMIILQTLQFLRDTCFTGKFHLSL